MRRPADPPFPVDLEGVAREWVEPVSVGRRWLGPVPLAGMDADQAERLRVRLVEGRARAERGVPR